MKALKINQTIGVLLIVIGAGWMMYALQSPKYKGYDASYGLYAFYIGLVWYGISRFIIWFKKD